MAKQRRWGPEEDKQLIELHSEGLGLNKIAKRMGWSPTCIHDKAKPLKLSWDRSMLVEAHLARVADAAVLRSALELDLLKDADKLRKQLFAPAMAYNFGGRDNTYSEQKIKQPTARDQADIMRATTSAIAHSLKISEHDVNAGSGAAIGMLDKIADGIKLAALDIAVEAG